MRNLTSAAVVCMCTCLPSFSQQMTPAFTVLSSEAKATYSFGQLHYTSHSGQAYSLVGQVFGLGVTWESDKDLRSYKPGQQVDIGFTLKNVGNGLDAFVVGYSGSASNWLVDSPYPIYEENGQHRLGTPIWLERDASKQLWLRVKGPSHKPPVTDEGTDGFYATLVAHSLGSSDVGIAQGLPTRWSQEIVLGREHLWKEVGWGRIHSQAFWATTVTAIGADSTGLYLGMSDKTIRVFRRSNSWHAYSIGVTPSGAPAFSSGYLAWSTEDGKLLIAPTSDPGKGGAWNPPGGLAVVSFPAPLADGFAVVLSDQRLTKVSFNGTWGPSLALPAPATTAPLLHDGLLYIGLTSGEVVCAAPSMELRWVSQLWQGPLGWLITGKGRFLAFATTTKKVGVLDVDSRFSAWSRPVPDPVRGLCQTDWGVYALCADGRLYGHSRVTGENLTGFPTRYQLPGASTGRLAPGVVALARSAHTPAYIWAATRAPVDQVGPTTDASIYAFCGSLGLNYYGIGRQPQVDSEVVDSVLPPVVVPFADAPRIAIAINGSFHPNGGNKSWVYLWRPDFGTSQ